VNPADADRGDEQHGDNRPRAVGERALDRDDLPDEENPLVVLAFPDEPAHRFVLDDLEDSPSVADLNPAYGASGRVATAAYESDLDHHAPGWRERPVDELAAVVEDHPELTGYTFPLDRLRAVDGDGGDEGGAP
jgi:hypothetical protein